MTAVAAAVALVVSLLVTRTLDIGESAPADDPAPVLPDPDGTVVSPDEITTDLVKDATTFWEAVAAGDQEAAQSLVDPSLPETGAATPFGRAETFDGQFDWYEAVSWKWTAGDCVAGATARTVECTMTPSNAWSNALGVEPVSGTFLVRFGDSGIVAVDDYLDSFVSQWSPMVFEVFSE